MTNSLKSVSTRKPTVASAARGTTAQTSKAVKGQKKNAAGGYTFVIADLERAKRFLILGSESNFYTSGAKMSKDNAKGIIKLASDPESSKALVDLIVDISTNGRAAKADPALFALAVAASYGDVDSKGYALAQLPAVARTGTHLFLFATYVEQFRGWGRMLQRAVASWYTSKGVDKLAYQAVKYQTREGWTHADLFRLSHPVSANVEFPGLAEWILRKDASNAPRLVKGFTEAHAEGADIPKLVREYGLSWEMLPTEALNKIDVWEALLEGSVPLGALIRQLPRLTRIGVLKPMSDLTLSVAARLTNTDELAKARIHPLNVLIALKTYASGGRSGRAYLRAAESATYEPLREITDALDKAFYLAFKTIEPANKRTMIGLDVSGSMGATFGDMPITSAEVGAAMALVTMATEPKTLVYGFDYSIKDLPISPNQRLDDVLAITRSRTFGSTDASALVRKALDEKIEVDTFIVITDNDTYAGNRHVFQVLSEYRQKVNASARLIVLSTEASRSSIADPNDDLSLDLAGFDSATPALISSFSRGL